MINYYDGDDYFQVCVRTTLVVKENKGPITKF